MRAASQQSGFAVAERVALVSLPFLVTKSSTRHQSFCSGFFLRHESDRCRPRRRLKVPLRCRTGVDGASNARLAAGGSAPSVSERCRPTTGSAALASIATTPSPEVRRLLLWFEPPAPRSCIGGLAP